MQNGGGGENKRCSLRRSVTPSDVECKVQRHQTNNGSANIASIQHPCRHAKFVSMQYPSKKAPVASVQQPWQHTHTVNYQQ